MDHKNKRPVKLFDFLLQASPNKVFISILFGMAAGLAYTLIIPLVTQSIAIGPAEKLATEAQQRLFVVGFEVTNPKFAISFFALCLFILLARTASQVILQRVAINATRKIRIDIYQRISQLPVIDVERIGPSRLHATIAKDVPDIMGGAAAFPNILISTATIVGLLGFLVYLNVYVFQFILGTIIFGIITYRVPLYFGNRFYTDAREKFDSIQEGIRGLIYGAKELKLNRAKQQAFLAHELVHHEDGLSKDTKNGILLITAALNYGNLIAFLAIGVAAFIISNQYAVSAEALVSIVMAMLYLTGPLGNILNSISPVIRGTIALKKLNMLLDDMPIEQYGDEGKKIGCQQLVLRDVRYRYNAKQNSESGFDIGPIDLVLNRGEVTFLVGGNGSGKSTLGKILSLHYVPQHGDIYFDGQKVTLQNRDLCRQNVAAIYTDFHLFPKLYGIDESKLTELAPSYLQSLGLAEKVTIEDGCFSTTNLSDGQKKRLALLVMYLEERDIYVFDEWAADQDPMFKDVFYTRILNELKGAGKMVIVISHDDRYFDLADNIVTMENGRIREQSASSVEAANPDEPELLPVEGA
ncbi:MAG: putative ATP-binding cassette transporter [Phenylobacterium sp.]|jgi:putative ATP-binding cassette transporter